MKKAALVIMAAGMASRYGGSKQVDGMGPNGEILMEYSIRDAIHAGFTKVVFIIKPEIREKLHEICGRKFENQIELCYAYQNFDSVPADVPAGRVKPFGTVHAVLCARGHVSEPFAVINADDYYGTESFAQMYAFLTGSRRESHAAMMGYRLGNTVSRHGAVTRGICQTENGLLTEVREVRRVQLTDDGRILDLADEANPEVLDPESSVSMNFWGFGPEIFPDLDADFRAFLADIPEGDLRAEFLLPVFVDRRLKSGALTVHVIPTHALWFGVTYKEDREKVASALKALHVQHLY